MTEVRDSVSIRRPSRDIFPEGPVGDEQYRYAQELVDTISEILTEFAHAINDLEDRVTALEP